MITILFIWLVIGVTVLGIGRLCFHYIFRGFLHNSPMPSTDAFDALWIGFFSITTFLQLSSLFFPIDIKIVLFIISIGVFGIIRRWREIYNEFAKSPKYLWVLWMIVSLFIAGLASTDTQHFDTYLYHLHSVHWFKEFGAVPGLVLLHDRLGFNSSIHLLEAAADNYVLHSYGYSANTIGPFMLAMLCCQWIKICISRNFTKETTFCFLTAPFILQLAPDKRFLPALSTDLPVYVFILLSCLYILRSDKQFLVMAVLTSCTAFTIKLSSLVFPISTGLFFVIQVYRKPFLRRHLFFVLVLLTPTIIGYSAIGYILSGWPSFPVKFGGIHTEWTIEKEKASHTQDVIKAWARKPGKDFMKSLKMPFMEWFKPWYNRVKFSSAMCYFYFGILGLMISFSNLSRCNFEVLWLLLTSIICIIIFMITAPELRFGGIFLAIFGSLPWLSIFNENTMKLRRSRVILVTITVLLLFVMPMQYSILLRSSIVKPWSLIEFEMTKIQHLAKNGTQFTYYKPIKGDRGGWAIPSTPYRPNDIAPRDIGDLGKGFKHDDGKTP